MSKLVETARRVLVAVVGFVQREPALSIAVAGAAAETFRKAIADGLAPFDAVRAAVIVAGGLLIRAKVTPVAKQLPPPLPPRRDPENPK